MAKSNGDDLWAECEDALLSDMKEAGMATSSEEIDILIEELGTSFKRYLTDAIEKSSLSEAQKKTVLNWEWRIVSKVTPNLTTIRVVLSFESIDDTRWSLYKQEYPAPVHMADLLNNGANGGRLMKNYVYGKWHGKKTRSRRIIPAEHFIENAWDKFRADYLKDSRIKNLSMSYEPEESTVF